MTKRSNSFASGPLSNPRHPNKPRRPHKKPRKPHRKPKKPHREPRKPHRDRTLAEDEVDVEKMVGELLRLTGVSSTTRSPLEYTILKKCGLLNSPSFPDLLNSVQLMVGKTM